MLKELVANNEAHFADAGGFVSPAGISYIGVSKEKLGEAAACAVKRINLDMRTARCAQRAGADLKEGWEVQGASFDKATGLWTVTSASGEKVGAGGEGESRSKKVTFSHNETKIYQETIIGLRKSAKAQSNIRIFKVWPLRGPLSFIFDFWP